MNPYRSFVHRVEPTREPSISASTELDTTKYRNTLTRPPIVMDVEAQAVREETLQLAGQRFRALRVEYRGFTMRGFDSPCGGPYKATAWYATDLGRLVRFDVRSTGCSIATKFVVDELIELTAIH